MIIPVEPITRWRHYFAQRFRQEDDGSIVVSGKRWIFALYLFVALMAINFPIVRICKGTWLAHYAENHVPIATLCFALVTVIFPPKRTLRFAATRREIVIRDSWLVFFHKTIVVPFSAIQDLTLVWPPAGQAAPLNRPALTLIHKSGRLYLMSLGTSLTHSTFADEVLSTVRQPQSSI